MTGEPPPARVIRALREFLELESAGGILLALAAAAALACANSPLAVLYQRFLDTPVEVRVGALDIAKPLLLWVNDGLMAVFFFLVGLELKREALQGELADPKQVLLPALAAAAGMALPAAIYVVLNRADAAALRGWAIPTATDIAFALGVLALLGERVPNGLKVFLLTLAILDDLGAIVIIAAFYTSELSAVSLAVAGAALAVLFALNRFKVWRAAPYLMVGLVLWVSVLKSGVHATLAGVALAMFIPLRAHDAEGTHSPLRRLENDLHPAVAYVILPLFAFANAGVPLAGLTPAALLAPVPLGIGAGLLVGKTLGVLGATWLAVRLGWARLPGGVGWGAMSGTALLCGVGFTMSLFIGGLAFESAAAHFAVETRLGILGGSLLSALAGYALLYAVLPRRAQAQA